VDKGQKKKSLPLWSFRFISITREGKSTKYLSKFCQQRENALEEEKSGVRETQV